MWPNDYEKVVIGMNAFDSSHEVFLIFYILQLVIALFVSELKEKREREKLKEEDDRRKRRGEMPRPRDS